ncbi:MAG: hypothetical protein ACTSX1_00690, partial [Candidatus Heimdallarchaeaceae archaeon]
MSDYKEFLKENHKKIMVEGKQYVEKYKPLVESIKDDYLQVTTAMLMENQIQMVNEATDLSVIGDSGKFIKYALPVIRRVFPNLIANKLVGIQPLMQATGFVFYLRYKFENARGQVKADTQMNLNQTTGLPGTSTDNVSSPYRNFPVNPYYSKDEIQSQRLELAGVFPFATDFAGSNYITVTLPEQTIAPSASNLYTIKVLEMDDTIASFNQVLNSVTYDGAIVTGTIGNSVVINSVAYNAGTRVLTVNIDSTAGTDTTIRAISVDYTLDLEANPDIAQLKIAIDRETVTAKTRKLKVIWTPEAAQDFKSYHGIDIEAELTALMSQEIAVEVDREIIADLLTISSKTIHFFDQGTATNGNYLDRHVALLQRIMLESNVIMRDTLRGKANWLVTSPEIASVLETLKEFRPYGGAAFAGLNPSGIGARGSLMNQIEVYVDPVFPKQKILMGYKGASVVDSGYFYAPY